MNKVFVVTYKHGHGLDVSVHRDQAIAYGHAVELAEKRVKQSWAWIDKKGFANTKYPEQLDCFNEMELHEYNGDEEILIHEREVR